MIPGDRMPWTARRSGEAADQSPCPSCGHPNSPDARFCENCGSELGTACPNCGTRNAPSARFCRRCGNQLVAAPQPAGSQPGPSRPASAAPGGSSFGVLAGSSIEALRTIAGGRYVISRFLGEGGRKRVYLGHDTRLDRDVALALIKTEGLDENGLVRVRREAQAMARLGDHPNVVTVFDIGEAEGRTFIVSQYMPGGSVDDLLAGAEGHRLPLDRAVRIALEVARALDHAHTRGIVHRDLKPANVWLGEDGSARLGDFGLAVALDRSRLTVDGMLVGTVAYIPPEQALGRKADAHSDLYSLGGLLYEMTTGRPPFLGDDAVAIISQHLHTPPVAPTWHNPDIPRPLEGLILALLEKDPAKRPESAADVVAALEALSRGLRTPGELAGTEAGPGPGTEEANPLDRLAGGIFVGRESEMEELRAKLDETLSGRGRLVLLVGEPGIGKTRTADELATYGALRGAQVLWGRCYEGEGAPTYWPWVQIVRSYVHERDPEVLASELGVGAPVIAQVVSEVRDRLPDLPPPPSLDPDQARFRLFDSVATFLKNASRARPLVLLLDDLHWADKPSLLLLAFVVRELAEARVLIVGTYRDVELRRDHPLSATLADLARERLSTRVLLRGLAQADVARYIEITAGMEPPPALVEKIYRETEGNPFFVAEVVRLLAGEGALASSPDAGSWSLTIPQGVREVVGRRLDALSRDCNELLTVASVIGRDFALNVLDEVSDLPGDRLLEVLEEAMASRLISEVPSSIGRFRFSHALIRETLYEELSTARRVRLHRRVGETLERLHAANLAPHLPELAHHFFEAAASGEVDKAIDYALRAGERASGMLGYEEAVEHYDRAMQALELRGADDSTRLDLLLMLGDAQWGAGEATNARATFLAAAAVARDLRDGRRLARAALRYGEVGFGGVYVEAWAYEPVKVGLLEEALTALADEESDLKVRVLARLAGALYFSYEDTSARREELSRSAVEAARRLGDGATLAYALNARHLAVWGPENVEERLALATELVQLSQQAADRPLELTGRVWRLADLLELGDVEGADREIRAYAGVAEELRQPRYLSYTFMFRAMRALMRGEFEETQRLARKAFELGRRVEDPNAILSYHVQMAMVGWTLHREAEFAESVQYVASAIPSDAPPAVTAYMEALSNRVADAWGQLRRASADDLRQIPRAFLLGGLSQMALLAGRIGDAVLAERFYEVLLPYEDRCAIAGRDVVVCFGSVARSLGALAGLLGRYEDAVGHYERAMEVNERMGSRTFLVNTMHEYAQTLLKRRGPGDRDAALGLLNRTIATAGAIGMRWLVQEAVADKLRAQGLSSVEVSTSVDAVAEAVQDERPDLRTHAAPDGTVTLMFTDIQGFTELNERLGDRGAREVLMAHNAIVRRQVASHGGTEVKSQGDGFMIAFPSARRGVASAVAIQRALAEHNRRVTEGGGDPILVRIGLHTGEAIQEAGDFYGRHVNLAARIAAKAMGGEILVSALTRELVAGAGEFVFGTTKEVELKGISGPHRLVPVVWEAEPEH